MNRVKDICTETNTPVISMTHPGDHAVRSQTLKPLGQGLETVTWQKVFACFGTCDRRLAL